MYKLKYIFGSTVNYNGEDRKVLEIRFIDNKVMYKLKGISYWVREEDI